MSSDRRTVGANFRNNCPGYQDNASKYSEFPY